MAYSLPHTFTSNTYSGRKLTLTISETVNADKNTSTLNWTLKSSGGSATFYSIAETTVKINGTQVYHKGETSWSDEVFPAKTGSTSGKITVTHNANGTKTGVTVVFKTQVYNSTVQDYGGTIDLTKIDTYTLDISADSHSKITVNRTSSGYTGASIGNIADGTRLYKGDKLEISFGADSGFIVSSHKVNNSSFTSGNTHTVSGNVSVTSSAEQTYKLTISTSSYGQVTVKRTSSNYGSTGNLSNNAVLYKNDKLQITFSVSSSTYQVDTHTVNGSTFTSGNTYTVSGNTTVVVSGKQLLTTAKSSGDMSGATGSITVTVTRYNTSYYHSIKAKVGSKTWWISVSDGVGSLSSTESKFVATSFSLATATTFFNWMPNKQSEVCTLTCYTYTSSSASSALGSTTSTFNVKTKESESRPVVTGTVIDTSDMVNLTESENILIPGYSLAQLTINTTVKYGADIESIKVNNEYIPSVSPISEIGYIGSLATSFNIEVTDSRGYKNTPLTIQPSGESISYTPLTFKYKLYRENPTDNTIKLTFSGNAFLDDFGGSYSNEIKIGYQYREAGTGSYSPINYINANNILTGATTYRSTDGQTPDSNVIELPETFDYRKSYQFKIYAKDGNSNVWFPFLEEYKDVTLTSLSYTTTVQKGIPVFDWGENDFRVNGDFSVVGDFNAPNHNNHVLWSYYNLGLSDGKQMTGDERIVLSERVQDQTHGLCICFKGAGDSIGTNRVSFFIPKNIISAGSTSLGSGFGYPFIMASPAHHTSTGTGDPDYWYTRLGHKYLYIYKESDDTGTYASDYGKTVIRGHLFNNNPFTWVTNRVMATDNDNWVLAWVYGV